MGDRALHTRVATEHRTPEERRAAEIERCARTQEFVSERKEAIFGCAPQIEDPLEAGCLAYKSCVEIARIHIDRAWHSFCDKPREWHLARAPRISHAEDFLRQRITDHAAPLFDGFHIPRDWTADIISTVGTPLSRFCNIEALVSLHACKGTSPHMFVTIGTPPQLKSRPRQANITLEDQRGISAAKIVGAVLDSLGDVFDGYSAQNITAQGLLVTPGQRCRTSRRES